MAANDPEPTWTLQTKTAAAQLTADAVEGEVALAEASSLRGAPARGPPGWDDAPEPDRDLTRD